MKRLRITRTTRGSWVPADAEIAHLVESYEEPEAVALECISAAIEDLRPGEYTTTRTLKEAKAEKFLAIDLRTDALVATGFAYGPHRYSLSNEAQSRFITMTLTVDTMSYPVLYNSIDDTHQLSLDTPADVLGFTGAAIATLRAHLDSGTALKNTVRACETVEQVDDVTDARSIAHE